MVPPPNKGVVYGYDTQAPLADWELLNDTGYDSADDCRNYQARTLDDWNSQTGWERNAGEADYDIQLNRLRSGMCVATNDPRLRGRHNSQF